MSAIDVDSLLQPVSEEQPCGENFEYETVFQEMEQAAQGKADTQFSEAEDPDWRTVRAKALEILGSSRDLRPLVYLARASLESEDWTTFGDCLSAMRGLLQEYWEALYPELDPDDPEQVMRVNAISGLSDHATLLSSLRKTPLVASRALGRFNIRDIDIANGILEVNLPEGEQPPNLANIQAAFMDSDVEEIQSLAAVIESAAADAATIESIFTEHLGAGYAPDLSPLVNELKKAHQFVAGQLVARGVGEAPPAAGEETSGQAAGGGGAVQAISGEIASRADVVRMIDKICDYYRRSEPSSPIPILLRRAKKLVDKEFVDIIRDLAPDAMTQIEVFTGPEAASEDSYYE